MAVVDLREVRGFVEERVTVVERPLDKVAEGLQGLLERGGRPLGAPGQWLKDFLNGVWLGHPLHPALSDVPLGAWTTALVLDLFGARRGADLAVKLGIAAAIPTAMAGLADWRDTEGGPRRTGLLHALLNTLGLGCYVGSWLARGAGSRPLGVGLSTTGLALSFGAAYLGGDLVFRQGTNVNRTAFAPEAEGWLAALPADRLVEGRLVGGEIEVDGEREPIVFLKRGGRIHALDGRCSHWGGPLAEGDLTEDDCVQCPWHGSRFSMADGTVRQGPASHPQPRYEARVRAEQVEVRRVG
jgi:nitrite reductase/ring-hydroxylating ferredoxin subunit